MTGLKLCSKTIYDNDDDAFMKTFPHEFYLIMLSNAFSNFSLSYFSFIVCIYKNRYTQTAV